MYPRNHHHTQENEHIHHPQKFPFLLCNLSLLQLHHFCPQATTDLLCHNRLVCIL